MPCPTALTWLSWVVISMLVILALDTIWATSIGRPCGSVRCNSRVVNPTARDGCLICTCKMPGTETGIMAAKVSTLTQQHTNRHQKKGRTRMNIPPLCERPSPRRCHYGRGVGVGDVLIDSCCSAMARRMLLTTG